MPKMHHLRAEPATPPAPVITPPAAAPAPVSEEQKPEPILERKPLSIAEALVKPDDLKEWTELNKVVVLVGKEDTDKMVRVVEADPGAVSPTGLLFLAKALAEQKRMDEAALYFYAGQLRANFDVARWPPRLDPEDVKRMQAEKSKTEDQQGQTTGASEPRLKNPHESVFNLSAAISPPISSWLFEDPDRAALVMVKVKAWDERATYEYKPNYDLPEALPFEQWPKLLTGTREGFFMRMNEFVVGLKKIKGK